MAKPNFTTPTSNGVYGLDRLPILAVDLTKVKTKATLMTALASGLRLPEHFGNNWDALADCVMDADWLAAGGCVVAISGARQCAKSLGEEFSTLQEIFSEAADFWQEKGKVFIVLLG